VAVGVDRLERDVLSVNVLGVPLYHGGNLLLMSYYKMNHSKYKPMVTNKF